MTFTMLPEPAVRVQLAFLTGQSDPKRCALSPAQQAFGQALLAPGRRLHPANFPYWPDSPAHQHSPLPRASWHNARQFLRSRQAAFATRHRDTVTALLRGAPHTVLLAGSCGLELLLNLDLPADLLDRTSVFAYGPVARRAPAVARLQAVVGRLDPIARLGWRGPAVLVPGGHLAYLRSGTTLDLARRFVDVVEASLPP